MALPYLDAMFIVAYARECTETFQDGHVRAFEFFGGVPSRISYDNARTSVSQIVGTHARKLTNGFLQLQSHYLFKDHFCRVRRADEKGVVEGVVKFARLNYFVPVPQVRDFDEVNAFQKTNRVARPLPQTTAHAHHAARIQNDRQVCTKDNQDHIVYLLRLVECETFEREQRATALGHAACAQGKRVRFLSVTGLVTQLFEARQDRQLERLFNRLEKLHLLVLEELGYVPFSKAGAELLFEVISRAYERQSLILTTNLPFEQWTEILGNERLTGALLDRVTHRVHIIEANGDS